VRAAKAGPFLDPLGVWGLAGNQSRGQPVGRVSGGLWPAVTL
jgi:hypothetical protein